MAIVLDGKKLSLKSEKDFSKRVEKIKAKNHSTPILATILVGSDPASATYVKMKGNACKRVGMDSMKIELDEATTTSELIEKIEELNSMRMYMEYCCSILFQSILMKDLVLMRSI